MHRNRGNKKVIRWPSELLMSQKYCWDTSKGTWKGILHTRMSLYTTGCDCSCMPWVRNRFMRRHSEVPWEHTKDTPQDLRYNERHMRILWTDQKGCEGSRFAQYINWMEKPSQASEKNISRCSYCTPYGSKFFMGHIKRYSMGCGAGPSAGIYRTDMWGCGLETDTRHNTSRSSASSNEFNMSAPFTGALDFLGSDSWLDDLSLPSSLATGVSASKLEQCWLRSLLGFEYNLSIPYPGTCSFLGWLSLEDSFKSAQCDNRQLQIACSKSLV